MDVDTPRPPELRRREELPQPPSKRPSADHPERGSEPPVPNPPRGLAPPPIQPRLLAAIKAAAASMTQLTAAATMPSSSSSGSTTRAARRSLESDEAARMRREADAARHARARIEMSNEDREAARAANTASRAEQRRLLSDDARSEIRSDDSSARAEKRRMLTADELEAIRSADASARARFRAELDPADIELERRRNAAAHRRAYSASGDTVTMLDRERSAAAGAAAFPVPTDHRRQAAAAAARLHQSSGLAEGVCAVCDELVLARDLTNLSGDGIPWRQIQAKLGRRDGDPTDTDLLDCYDTTAFFGDVSSNVWLSPSGCQVALNDEDGSVNPSLTICATCKESLLSDASANPPKMAIANNNWCGIAPAPLADTTYAEWVAVGLLHSTVRTVQLGWVQAGAGRALTHHVLSANRDPADLTAAVHRQLPLLPEELREFIYVIVASSTTSAERARALRPLQVRPKRLIDLLEWLRRHNHQYATIDMAAAHARVGVWLRKVGAAGNIPPAILEEMEDPRPDDAAEPPAPMGGEQVQAGDVIRRANIAQQSFASEPADDTSSSAGLVAQLNNNKNGALFVHRDKEGFARDWDAAALTRHWPSLFPFGRGGPDEERRCKVSKEKLIRHYLRLSSRKFAQHPQFPLWMYDVENRRRALESLRISGTCAPEYAAIRVPDMLEAIRVLESAKALRYAGRPVPAIPPHLTNATNFIHSARRVEGAMWNTKGEKDTQRDELWATFNAYGAPQLFLTVNPHELMSDVAAAYAGLPPGSGRAARAEALAADPVAAARWFHRVITETFIEKLLGFDIKNRRSKVEGGIYGRVRAFYGSVEAQDRGALHFHVLVWLEGWQNVSDDGAKSFGAAVTTSKFALDVNADAAKIACAKCGASGRWKALRWDAKRLSFTARRGLASEEPRLVECEACHSRQPISVLQDRLLAHYFQPASLSALTADGLSGVEERDRLLSDPDKWCAAHKAGESVSAEAKLALLQKFCQTHNWRHTNTCFKMGDKGTCRHHFPRLAGSQRAGSGEDNELGAWLNLHSPDTLLALACNHDVSVLMSAAAHGAVYYVSMYTVKIDQPGRQAALELASFKRRLEREQNGEAPAQDERARSMSRITAVAMGATGETRTPAQLCAYYLLTGSCAISSHTFVPLAVPQAQAYLEGRPITSGQMYRRPSEEAGCDVVQFVSPVQAYACRGDIIKHLSLHEWCALYRVSKKTKDPNDEEELIGTNSLVPRRLGPADILYRDADVAGGQWVALLPPHPQAHTHHLTLRPGEVTPLVRINGGRLPRQDWNDERYCEMAQLLFKPWRTRADLLGMLAGDEQPNFRAGAALWRADGLSLAATRGLDNMEAYWRCKSAADAAKSSTDPIADLDELEQQRQQHEEGDHHDLDDAAANGADEQLLQDDSEASERNFATGELSGVARAYLARAAANAPASGAAAANLFNDINIIKQALARRAEAAAKDLDGESFVSDAWMPIPDRLGSMTADAEDATAAAVADEDDDDDDDEDSEADAMLEGGRRQEPTIVFYHSMVDAIRSEDQASADGPADVELLPPRPTIAATIAAARLNSKQALLLRLAICSLFRTVLERDMAVDKGTDGALRLAMEHAAAELRRLDCGGEHARVLYMGGPGGTGKSHVIHTLVTFADKWAIGNLVHVTATTGVAAVNINGATVHSKIGGRWLSSSSSARSRRASSGKPHVLSNSALLIIDEISFFGAAQFHHLALALQRIVPSTRPEVEPFGATNLLLVGDFAQLPPVGGTPLYALRDLPQSVSSDVKAGLELWRRCLSSVVLLDQVMRQVGAENAGLVTMLGALRRGLMTDAQRQWLNDSCCVQAPGGPARFSSLSSSLLPASSSALASSSSSSSSSFSSSSSSSSSSSAAAAAARRVLHARTELPASVTVVTPSNAERMAINAADVAAAAGAGVNVVRLLSTCTTTDGQPLTDKLLRWLHTTATESVTEKVAPVLDVFPGQRIRVVKNVATKLGVANGTLGVVRRIVWRPEELARGVVQPVTVRISDQLCTVNLACVPPAYIEVRITDKPAADRVLVDGFERGCFPLSLTKLTVPLNFGRLHIDAGSRQLNMSVRLTQFPLVGAAALTGHNTQGRTIRGGVLITSFRARHPPPPQWAYVVLSRATAIDGIFLLTPMEPRDLIRCRLGEDLTAHEAWLLDKERQTESACVVPRDS